MIRLDLFGTDMPWKHLKNLNMCSQFFQIDEHQVQQKVPTAPDQNTHPSEGKDYGKQAHDHGNHLQGKKIHRKAKDERLFSDITVWCIGFHSNDENRLYGHSD
tara:strand:+ start:59240 stop:59548 length:309 start_codon:yes stop_codon:yes gene_type:complete